MTKKIIRTKEELQQIANECSNKTEFAKRLGFIFSNGKLFNTIEAQMQSLGVSIEHFDRFKKSRARRKYPLIKKNCPVCNKEFETQQGHPKEKTTCSCACSNTWFSDIRQTEKSKEKKSVAQLKHNQSLDIPRIKVGNKSFKAHTKDCQE